MAIFKFRGGFVPPETKHTAGIPIKEVWPKAGDEMVYPMLQHLGAPCTPLVQKGDRVLLGQRIGEPGGFLSAPIFASVSGTVKAVEPRLIPGGTRPNAVIIEADGGEGLDSQETHPDILGKGVENFQDLSRDEVLERIKNAGIVGQGGAGFPAHIKLNPPPDKTVDTLIVNGSECEFYVTSDHRIMLEEADVLLRGMKIFGMIHPKAALIIAIEQDKPDAIALIQQKISEDAELSKKAARVVTLPSRYAIGSEKQLIKACTGREVRSGQLPADAGCIVHNVDTIIGIERAVVRGRPIMRRVLTLAGGAVANPGNYKVRLGMSFQQVIDATGGFKEEPTKIIAGGAMMGTAVYTTELPIVKTTSGITCLTAAEAPVPKEDPCIRCARCVNTCPIGLMPLVLNAHAIKNNEDAFVENNGMDCIECGSCSYVCPAKRHLVQSIRFQKRQILGKRQAAAKK